MKGHKEVMEYWGKVANIKRWCRFGFLTPQQAHKALKRLKKGKNERKP